jgi:hypothetical protein
MADAATAVRVAIDLLQMPSRARMMRQSPLPDGMALLLRVAATEPDATAEAAALTGRTPDVVFQASAFFVEQILMASDANSYRVLGATAQSSSADLRRNMALLVRWLHPDVKRSTDRASFVNRVTLAWDDLKTAERRADYDQTLSAEQKSPSGTGTKPTDKHRSRTGKATRSADRRNPERVSLFRRALRLLLNRGRQ